MTTKSWNYMKAMGGPAAPKDEGHDGQCYACGGMVGEDGKAFGGEVPELDEDDAFTNEPEDEDTHKAKFLSAIMKKKEK